MNRISGMSGQRFTRLIVVMEMERKAYVYGGEPKYFRMFKCLCDCGNEISARMDNLRGGRTKSCGCLEVDLDRSRKSRSGGRYSPTRASWSHMIWRTSTKNSHHYPHYGARGISVCERWRKFENFLADMGERPDGKTIDRINNDGNYEPGNCKWSTRREQVNNQRPRDVDRCHFVPPIRINLLSPQGATQ
jgi:hypothetical protein